MPSAPRPGSFSNAWRVEEGRRGTDCLHRSIWRPLEGGRSEGCPDGGARYAKEAVCDVEEGVKDEEGTDGAGDEGHGKFLIARNEFCC